MGAEGLGRSGVPGSAVEPGWTYHEVPGSGVPFHRGGTVARARAIGRAVGGAESLRGLDVGCAVGGLSMELALSGASMVGVDADLSAVRFGNEQAAQRCPARPPILVHARVPSDRFEAMVPAGRYDFALFLSCFMWVAFEEGIPEARGVVRFLRDRVPVVFFETAAAGDGGAGDASGFLDQDAVEAWLRGEFQEVESLGVVGGSWGRERRLFKCSGGAR